MIWKLKNLALLAGALLTLGGLMASAAGAHTPAKFTSEKSLTTITGVPDGPYIIQATGLAVECKNAELHGVVEGTSVEQVTLTPALSECTAFGSLNVKITGFGLYGEKESCQLVMHADGTGDLVCAPGTDVTLDGGTCVVHLSPQKGIKGFNFTKVEHEGKNALTVDIHLTELSGSHTDGFLCPFAGSGEFSGTTAAGTGLVTGVDPVTHEPVGITQDATTP